MKIIGCEIFRREVEHVAPEYAAAVEWLPTALHADLPEMQAALE